MRGISLPRHFSPRLKAEGQAGGKLELFSRLYFKRGACIRPRILRAFAELPGECANCQNGVPVPRRLRPEKH